MKIKLVLACLLFTAVQGWSQFMNWSYVNVLDDLQESGINPDMVLDGNGGIHITAWDAAADKLIYLYRAPGGSSFTKEFVDATSANGFKSAITLSSTGVPHVTYLADDAGNAQVYYAFRNGPGSWTKEMIPPDTSIGWGQYGPNAPMVQTERIKNSMDIIFDNNGTIQIVFFDGYWETPLTPPNCDAQSTYGLKLHQAKKISGGWEVITLGSIPDDNLSCDGDSLPEGDRFGEFSTLVQKNNGNLAVVTMARMNNDIVQFETTVDDTTWEWDIVYRGDSIVGGPVGSANVFYTLEGVSAEISPDGNIHTSYTSSFFYGENFCCVPFVCGHNYSRIDTSGAIVNYKFGLGTYRNNTSTTTAGNDSVFILYADQTTNQTLLKFSADRGLTWSTDTIFNWATTCDQKIKIHGDSVYACVFNPVAHKLQLAVRETATAGNWVVSNITESANRGQSLDAQVEIAAGDTTLHLAYNDDYNEVLYYNEGNLNNGTWSFSEEQVDPSGTHFDAVSTTLGPAGQAVIAYAEGNDGNLKIAIDNGGSWSYSIIDTAVNALFTQVEKGSNDTLYVIYYAADTQALKYARRHFSGSTWQVDYINAVNPPVGQHPSLSIDNSGRLHVSYFNQTLSALIYATRPATSANWTQDTVFSNLPSAAGKFSSIEIGLDGLPKIAFLDEFINYVRLAEKTAGGSWTITNLDSTNNISNGRPTDLEIDQFGNPWVAFNNNINFDLAALVHRDTVWRSISVDPTGRIARSFKLLIGGGDIFLVGHKTQIGNAGIAMLYAPNGIFISREEAAIPPVQQVKVYPNPLSGEGTLEVVLAQPTEVSLSITNLLGQPVVNVLKNEKLQSGKHEIAFSAHQLPAGIYLWQMQSGAQMLAGKIVIAAVND